MCTHYTVHKHSMFACLFFGVQILKQKPGVFHKALVNKGNISNVAVVSFIPHYKGKPKELNKVICQLLWWKMKGTLRINMQIHLFCRLFHSLLGRPYMQDSLAFWPFILCLSMSNTGMHITCMCSSKKRQDLRHLVESVIVIDWCRRRPVTSRSENMTENMYHYTQ